MDTVKLTIRLPRGDLEFAKGYAREHGITVTEFIDRYLRRMRALEGGTPVAELEAIMGLVPSDVDVESEHRRHRLEKHDQ